MNGIRPFSSDPDDRCGAGRKRGQFAGYVHSTPQDEASKFAVGIPLLAGRIDATLNAEVVFADYHIELQLKSLKKILIA